MFKKICVLFIIALMALMPLQAALKEVVLRNGERIPEKVLHSSLITIYYLWETDPLLFWFGIVEKAKDPDYEFSARQKKKLTLLGMLENGEMPDLIRAIMLSMIEGEGLEAKIVNPVQPVKKDL